MEKFKLTPKEKSEESPKGLVDKNGRPISINTAEETWINKRPKEKKEIKKETEEDNKKSLEKFKVLKNKISELNEKYILETQKESKALIYSELEKAKKEYVDLEARLDTTPKMSEEEKKEKETTELKNLLDLLNKARQGSREHEDVYWHVFGKGSKTDAPYPKSLINRPDLLEKFAVGKNGEPYTDTRTASHDLMEFLANETEEKLKKPTKKKEIIQEDPTPPPVVVVPPEEEHVVDPLPPEEPPIVDPLPPEETPVVVVPPTPPELKKPKKLVAVEAKDVVDFLARERGAKLLNEKLNQASALKRKWTQMWEPAYRAMFIEQERKKILGKENKPGWFKRTFFGATGSEAGQKNLMAGTGQEAEGEAELKALVERFSADYVDSAESKQRKQLEDPDLKTKINDLIHEYAVGKMSDAEFDAKKDAIMEEVAQKYPDVVEHDGLTADNFLEAAKEFQKIYIHNQGLARTDVALEIDLGKAKKAIKTQVNLTWVDKSMSWVQKHGGPAVSPEAIGIGLSIGSFFSRKPLYWLGGAAGIGGLLGAMRKNVEQKHDLEMHRVERAMGDEIKDFGPDAKRRQGKEQFVYEMKKASEIVLNIRALSDAFHTSSTKENADKLVSALAEAEARQSLSTERQKDLISFSGETVLERGRLELLRTLAEAKVLLGKSAFAPGEITTTEDYDKFMKSLGADMDKIDSSERWSRWGANAKAGAVGAVGGLVVGGLIQQVGAYTADYFPKLGFLRPGGKLTGIEKLSDYIYGNVSTGPTGAGATWISTLSNTGMLKIDADTHITYDKVTGLMSMYEAGVSNPKMLAQFNLDPATGHITPVPDSYDPNLIAFNETSNGGGAKTLTEWLDSVKENLGSNVAQEKWHLGGSGFFHNDTPSPTDTQFNELRLFTSYDAKGNLKIDASKLQEFLTDTAGKQIEGSSNAGEILKIGEAFNSGKIKIGLIPDASKPSEALELMMDPITKTFTSTDGSDIGKFFEPDPKTGIPVLKGNALLGMVHEIGVRPDGSHNIEWINAIKGNGEPIETGTKPQLITEITRKVPKDWAGLWAWNFRRNPLEKKTDEQSKDKETSGKITPLGEKKKDGIYPFKMTGFEVPVDTGEKIKDKTIKEVTVDTRGQKVESDRKDHEEGFPKKFPLKTDQEMVKYLLSNDFVATGADLEKLNKAKSLIEKEIILKKLIRQERKNLKIGNTLFTEELMQGTIDAVLNQVDKTLTKYGGKEGRSALPKKDKIHVVGLLEYQAQAGIAQKNALGVCFLDSGELFINFEALKQGTINPDEFMSHLKTTLAHEIMHDSSANNYWMFQMEAGDEVVVPRRTGIEFIRRQKVGDGKQLVVERGRALNEAVIESLAQETIKELYSSEKTKQPETKIPVYTAERHILKMLQEKFDIKFDDFAKAVINRRGLRGLAEKLDGVVAPTEGESGKRTMRPKFMSLLMSVMDFEHKKGKVLYSITQKLIRGEKNIYISKEMKRGFPSNLLDKNGNIMASVLEKYSLIDEEVKEKGGMPIAA